MSQDVEHPFDLSLQRFLISVKERQFSIFNEFLSDTLEFYAELPGGRIFNNDVPAFIESQKAWFQSRTGTFEYAIESTHCTSGEATAVVLVNYSDVAENGTAFSLEIRITFKFRSRNGTWFLVYDHNEVLHHRQHETESD
jgi:hypothetical protein